MGVWGRLDVPMDVTRDVLRGVVSMGVCEDVSPGVGKDVPKAM